MALESLNGRFGGSAIRHLHKAKASGATGIAVRDDIDLVHRTIELEELTKVKIRRTKRKVPDKDIHATILYNGNMETLARSSEQYAGAQGQSYTEEKRRRKPGGPKQYEVTLQN